MFLIDVLSKEILNLNGDLSWWILLVTLRFLIHVFPWGLMEGFGTRRPLKSWTKTTERNNTNCIWQSLLQSQELKHPLERHLAYLSSLLPKKGEKVDNWTNQNKKRAGKSIAPTNWTWFHHGSTETRHEILVGHEVQENPCNKIPLNLLMLDDIFPSYNM